MNQPRPQSALGTRLSMNVPLSFTFILTSSLEHLLPKRNSITLSFVPGFLILAQVPGSDFICAIL